MGLQSKYKLLLLTSSDARGRLEVHKNITFTTQRAFCPEKKKKTRCWKHVFKKLHRLKEKGKRSQKGSKRRLEEEEVVLVVGTRWSVSSLVLVWSVSPLAAAKH